MNNTDKDNFQIAIIDYGMGNLFSIKRACEYVGLVSKITSNKNEILNAQAIILPGIGAFGDAMINLKNLDLVEVIKDFVQTGRIIIGVCLGMQLLMTESEEFGVHKGLNIIEGNVVRFNSNLKKIKIPNIGWNKIFMFTVEQITSWADSPLNNIANGEFMYFAHSYFAVPVDLNNILAISNYDGIEYCCSIHNRNIFAFQFHPEKSGIHGLKIYKNIKKHIEES